MNFKDALLQHYGFNANNGEVIIAGINGGEQSLMVTLQIVVTNDDLIEIAEAMKEE